MAASGLRDPILSRGKVTIDANQYRVRGRYILTIDEDLNVTFEFNSSTLAGSHVEDVVVSMYQDTLRVLDRERGSYYEGKDVEQRVQESSDIAVIAAEVVRRIAGQIPPCSDLSDIDLGDERVRGRSSGYPFEISFRDGLVSSARWASPFPDENEHLELSYRWEDQKLDGLTIFMPGQRWRVKLSDEQ
jgi:hypothetical protein